MFSIIMVKKSYVGML